MLSQLGKFVSEKIAVRLILSSILIAANLDEITNLHVLQCFTLTTFCLSKSAFVL